ncbi:MAG TPA: hypothetical protein VFZ00_01505 [Solirubrobacter sp.]|nr:hypothetical protein [Solirubrobacter sp.]
MSWLEWLAARFPTVAGTLVVLGLLTLIVRDVRRGPCPARLPVLDAPPRDARPRPIDDIDLEPWPERWVS